MTHEPTTHREHQGELSIERLIQQRDRARARGNRAVRCLAVLMNLHDGPADRRRRDGEAAWQSARELLDSERTR